MYLSVELHFALEADLIRISGSSLNSAPISVGNVQSWMLDIFVDTVLESLGVLLIII